MKNILLIHIGIRKTGSSALQLFLYKNMNKLEEYGWCYPEFQQELYGIEFVSTKKERNGRIFFKEAGCLDTEAENWKQAWKLVIKKLQHKNVIISEERLNIWHTNEFLIKAKEKYDNIKVVIYLRRQDRAIESRWNQSVKNPIGCYQTFQEFICSSEEKDCTEYHYKKQLDEISEIIGKSNLIVRVYEKDQLYGNAIETDFLSVLGIRADLDEWERCGFQNLRLESNFLEIKRIFNSLRLVEGIDITKGPYWESFSRLSNAFSEEKTNYYFNNEDRVKFLKQFEKENEEIAREYLHRSNGILFHDINTNYSINKKKEDTFTEDIIRVFSMFILNQFEELQKIRKYNCFLAEKILVNNYIKGRKMVLFGAGYKCKDLLETLKISIDMIVDNNIDKVGKRLGGIKIVDAQKVENWEMYFIIITCYETEEIERQLQNYGLKGERDYILAKDYFACY